MDGTLVDSEELHWRAWREAMAHEGISITHDQFLSSFGERNDSIIPLWLGDDAAPERVRKIEMDKEDRFRRAVRDAGILPLLGVVGLVNRLSETGWLQAVASSAPRANVETVLGEMGIANSFQAIVSAEDVLDQLEAYALRKSTLINRYNSVAHQALSQWLGYRQAKFVVSSESSLPLYCACFG